MKNLLIINEVKYRLEHNAQMRDDDALLMADIWREQLIMLGAYTSTHVLDAIAGKLLHSPESIRRSRQKLQSENPNLRGTVYKKRFEKEIEVLQELGYIK